MAQERDGEKRPTCRVSLAHDSFKFKCKCILPRNQGLVNKIESILGIIRMLFNVESVTQVMESGAGNQQGFLMEVGPWGKATCWNQQEAQKLLEMLREGLGDVFILELPYFSVSDCPMVAPRRP